MTGYELSWHFKYPCIRSDHEISPQRASPTMLGRQMPLAVPFHAPHAIRAPLRLQDYSSLHQPQYQPQYSPYQGSANHSVASPTYYNNNPAPFHSPPMGYSHPATTLAMEPQPRHEGPAFDGTKTIYPLIDQQGAKHCPEIHAKIQKNFFKMDGKWTCYRRNYFNVQVHVTLDVPQMPQLYVQVARDNQAAPVRNFAVALAAKTQDVNEREGETRELIQHTAKRSKETQTKPPKVPLVLVTPAYTMHGAPPIGATSFSAYTGFPAMSFPSYGFDPRYLQQPVPSQPQAAQHIYERLQFQRATLNNGKRRAQQQYYHLVVELYADIGRGPKAEWHKIATRQSEAVVVRGRSPGHYKDGKDRDANPGPGAASSGNRINQQGSHVLSDAYQAHSMGWQGTHRGSYHPSGPEDEEEQGDTIDSDYDGDITPDSQRGSSNERSSSGDYHSIAHEAEINRGYVPVRMHEQNGIFAPGRNQIGFLPQGRSNIAQVMN